jgi:hypothetical protein
VLAPATSTFSAPTRLPGVSDDLHRADRDAGDVRDVVGGALRRSQPRDHVIGPDRPPGRNKGAPAAAEVADGVSSRRVRGACLGHVAQYHLVMAVMVGLVWAVRPSGTRTENSGRRQVSPGRRTCAASSRDDRQPGRLAMTTRPGPLYSSGGSRNSATGFRPACSIRLTSCSGRHLCVVQRTGTPP